VKKFVLLVKWIAILAIVVFGFFLYFRNVASLKKEVVLMETKFQEAKELLDAKEVRISELLVELEKKRQLEANIRKELEGEIARLTKEKDDLVNSYSALKAKVEKADSNFLVGEIGKRIGRKEIKFTLAGEFVLTRTGANRTLFKFYDGEKAEKEVAVLSEMVDSYQRKTISYENAIRIYKQELKANIELKDSALATLAACEKAKKAITDAYKAKQWRSRGEGIILGIAITIVGAKVFGVI